jgi:hypothetical protein
VGKENARHNKRDDPAQFIADLNRLLADLFLPNSPTKTNHRPTKAEAEGDEEAEKEEVLPWRVVGLPLDSIWGMVEQQQHREAMDDNAAHILARQGRRGVFRGRQAKSSFRALLKGLRDGRSSSSSGGSKKKKGRLL